MPPGPAIPAPQRLPASSRSSRGEITGGGVPAPAFRPVPCPRLPPMPGYRGMRGLFSGIRPPGEEHILSLRVPAPPACGKFRAVPGFCPVLAGSPFSAGLMKILPVRPEACLRLPGMPDCKFPVSRGQRQSFHHHDAHVPGAQKSLFPGYRKEASLVIYGRMATYASRDPLPRRASRR